MKLKQYLEKLLKHEIRKTLIKKGATIGANATIICGISIGNYALIGAGAVIRETVPNFAIMVGVPAKQIGWVCKCGLKLDTSKKTITCSCNLSYTLSNNMLRLKD